MPLYEWGCPRCEEVTSVIRRIDDRGVAPDGGCEHCGELAIYRKLAAPGLMFTAIPDGQGRPGKEKDSYRKLREAARLEKDAASLPHQRRGDLQKEIKKLRSIDK